MALGRRLDTGASTKWPSIFQKMFQIFCIVCTSQNPDVYPPRRYAATKRQRMGPYLNKYAACSRLYILGLGLRPICGLSESYRSFKISVVLKIYGYKITVMRLQQSQDYCVQFWHLRVWALIVHTVVNNLSWPEMLLKPAPRTRTRLVVFFISLVFTE